MRGILIVNTGSPASNKTEDVKHFIGEMLSDPMLITVPDWFRPILAKNIIAPFRASKSASHYSLIWDNVHNESPLIYNTRLLAQKIEKETGLPVETAMRYGQPSITGAFEKLKNKSSLLHEVVVVPMFPHYAQSSYETVIKEIGACFYKESFPFRLKFLEPFYSDPEYIHALAISLKPYIEKKYDRLVFCFHSLPLSHEEKARKKGKQFDYVYQIKETVRLVTKELGLNPNINRVVYSSAMGNDWLKPGLDDTMELLPKENADNIIALCPGFTADNLETLYDVSIKAREIFLKNGGKDFNYVPCLNSEDYWAEAVIKMVTRIV